MTASKDLLAGLVFLGVGVFLLVQGQSYRLGTLLRMGPGYFPVLIGVSMSLVGVGLVVQALRTGGEPVPRPALKPLVLVTASLVAFALTLSRLGLVLATLVLIVLSRLASPRGTVKETLVLAAATIVAGVAIFHSILELPLKLWP